MCTTAHTSASASQPGTGANWTTYWILAGTGTELIEFTASGHNFQVGQLVEFQGLTSHTGMNGNAFYVTAVGRQHIQGGLPVERKPGRGQWIRAKAHSRDPSNNLWRSRTDTGPQRQYPQLCLSQQDGRRVASPYRRPWRRVMTPIATSGGKGNGAICENPPMFKLSSTFVLPLPILPRNIPTITAPVRIPARQPTFR